MNQIEVGRFIRTRREALQPEDVGMGRGSRRRSIGLRREEVADLADMSADYLSRLERGAGPQPSVQMINALARGPRLTVDERDHLLRLAGHQPSTKPGSSAHANPGLMRILDRLIDTSHGPLGETIAQNFCAIALLGEETHYSGPCEAPLTGGSSTPGRALSIPRKTTSTTAESTSPNSAVQPPDSRPRARHHSSSTCRTTARSLLVCGK